MEKSMPVGAALSRADKYYVYRPMLDLTGRSEGTAKRDGYNETLGYGIMLDSKVTKGKGTSVKLVGMTLDRGGRRHARQSRPRRASTARRR